MFVKLVYLIQNTNNGFIYTSKARDAHASVQGHCEQAAQLIDHYQLHLY